MNLKRSGAIVGLAMSGLLVLSACGSDKGGDSGTRVEGVNCEGKATLSAGGASSQKNAMAHFSNSYSRSCEGKKLNYNSSNSGQGIGDFKAGRSDIGGSDSPLSAEDAAGAADRCKSPAWNLPLVFGPIAVAYNLEGVGELNLSAATIAEIFSGKIAKWNDAKLAALNPGVALPDIAITVVYRGESSGTTDNFQRYLHAAAGEAWGKGAGKDFKGGVGEGAQGNDGVASAVKNTPGAITYNEWSFAKANNLGIARVVTHEGQPAVELNSESVGRTIEGATLLNGDASHDMVLDLTSFYRPEARGAYPIVMATYEIVCSDYADDQTAGAVRSFLSVAASQEVQAGLVSGGYAPIPDAFRTKLMSAIDAIQ